MYFAHPDQVGFLAAEQLTRFSFAFHIAMLPKAAGVKEFVKEVMSFLILVYDVKKFVSLTPADNKAAARLARSVGAEQEGLIKSIFMRDGKLRDIIVFGITVDGN